MCGRRWGWLLGCRWTFDGGLLWLWKFVILFRGCMGGGREWGGRGLGMGRGEGGCGVG